MKHRWEIEERSKDFIRTLYTGLTHPKLKKRKLGSESLNNENLTRLSTVKGNI